MRVFHAFTEGYMNQEQRGLVCIKFENLVSGWTGCVSEEMRCVGNHLPLLSYQWMGLLVHW